MNITFNNDVIIKYHLEDGREYDHLSPNSGSFFLLFIDEVRDHFKITKLESKKTKITQYNASTYKINKTDKDIHINVRYKEAYLLEVNYLNDSSLNEKYNLTENEDIQLVFDDYMEGSILHRITVRGKNNSSINFKELKLSSYKNSLRHYIDLKMPKEDVVVTVEYVIDKENQLMYEDEDGGYSALSDEEYDILFEDLLVK